MKISAWQLGTADECQALLEAVATTLFPEDFWLFSGWADGRYVMGQRASLPADSQLAMSGRAFANTGELRWRRDREMRIVTAIHATEVVFDVEPRDMLDLDPLGDERAFVLRGRAKSGKYHSGRIPKALPYDLGGEPPTDGSWIQVTAQVLADRMGGANFTRFLNVETKEGQ